MGNCCRPEEVEDKRGQVEVPVKSKSRDINRGVSLNANSVEAIREKYKRWIDEKQSIIAKNEQEIQAKKTKLKILQASNKPLEVEKIRRQIDTH